MPEHRAAELTAENGLFQSFSKCSTRGVMCCSHCYSVRVRVIAGRPLRCDRIV